MRTLIVFRVEIRSEDGSDDTTLSETHQGKTPLPRHYAVDLMQGLNEYTQRFFHERGLTIT